jgi:hypothetical protein
MQFLKIREPVGLSESSVMTNMENKKAALTRAAFE